MSDIISVDEDVDYGGLSPAHNLAGEVGHAEVRPLRPQLSVEVEVEIIVYEDDMCILWQVQSVRTATAITMPTADQSEQPAQEV